MTLRPWLYRGGSSLLLVLVGLVAACSDPGATPTAPVEMEAVDLYILPPTALGATVGRQGWAFRAREVTLSTEQDAPAEIDIPDGGQTQGQVIQLEVADGGLEVQTVAVLARVEAFGDDGLGYVATVDSGLFTNEFILRAPAGVYDVRVEPYDRSLMPLWLRDVALPADGLDVVVPDGIQIRGTVTDGALDAPLPLAGVGVIPRDPVTNDRTGSVGITSDTGTFAVRVPQGDHVLWLSRDVAAGEDLAPIPAVAGAAITVPPEGLAPLSIPLSIPPTVHVSGGVTYADRYVDAVTITATRVVDDTWPEGALTAVGVTGSSGGDPSSRYSLELPEGSYTLSASPPTSASDPLASRTQGEDPPYYLTGADATIDFALSVWIVGLRGELLQDDGEPARGTSLFFLPDEPLHPPISTMARGDLGTFSVGSTPAGGIPIALAPGGHEVVLCPPVDSALARQVEAINLVAGQSRLELPELERGYSAWGRLGGEALPSYVGAVVKVVPAGAGSWDERWGPGPDPREVLAEALVAEDGTFELRLPRP